MRNETVMTPLRPDRIIRSHRRTVSLEITPDAGLVVRAPLRAPETWIQEIIEEKRTWIEKKVAEMKSRPDPGTRSFAAGEQFLFLGKPFALAVLAGSDAGITLADRLYIGELQLPECKKLLQAWYTRKAAEILPVRVAGVAAILDYVPKKIRITDARRRWASCSSTGTLSFSWRLVLAPPEVIDYVVVHELVHLRQPDHSDRFWAKVEKAMPDYREHREWLRTNERMLTL
ncbi:SprT family zinc-dependent metalloprotease [Methanoregula sp.]|uniref:M48 family metallopeptidase n=1 Tax=Methanoregula sp. TaxID=2052170 RepID=UPI002BD7A44E|nr:SprT family zinc-dependent metalloprotease [Methanoregula sp.]HVP97432.1 SprT family zinc-dependent metalloprotease [Methanoregula sp.]